MSKICILGREKLKNTCDFCGESFQNSDELNTHVVSVHEEPNNYEVTTSYFEPVVQVDVLDPEEDADTFETDYFEPETVIEEDMYNENIECDSENIFAETIVSDQEINPMPSTSSQ